MLFFAVAAQEHKENSKTQKDVSAAKDPKVVHEDNNEVEQMEGTNLTLFLQCCRFSVVTDHS